MTNADRQSRLQGWIAAFPVAQTQPWLRYGAALMLTLVAFVARSALDRVLPPGFPYVTFFPAIVICAFCFGLGPGVLSAVLGFFLSWYFFIVPVHNFALTSGAAVALGMYLFVVVVDLALIHGMQLANARLAEERERNRKLADLREVLFHELQHRVGNNLQMVGSLLSLQRRKLADGDARRAIDEASQRLQMIGRIQRDLYHPDGEATPIAQHVRRIAEDMIAQAGRADLKLTVSEDRPRVLAPDQAVPASLIFAETLANAIEHGLPDCAGSIAIHVGGDDDRLRIRVSNDGNVLQPGEVLEIGSSLGLRLSDALARQMGGAYLVCGEDRLTVAELSIPSA